MLRIHLAAAVAAFACIGAAAADITPVRALPPGYSHADDVTPDAAELVATECKMPDCMMVRPRDIVALINANKALAKQLQDMKRDLDEARRARVQVVPK